MLFGSVVLKHHRHGSHSWTRTRRLDAHHHSQWPGLPMQGTAPPFPDMQHLTSLPRISRPLADDAEQCSKTGSGLRLYRRLATRLPLHPGHGGSTSGFRSLSWALDPVIAARCCVAAGMDYLAGPCLACPGSLWLDQRSLLIHPFNFLPWIPTHALGPPLPNLQAPSAEVYVHAEASSRHAFPQTIPEIVFCQRNSHASPDTLATIRCRSVVGPVAVRGLGLVARSSRPLTPLRSMLVPLF